MPKQKKRCVSKTDFFFGYTHIFLTHGAKEEAEAKDAIQRTRESCAAKEQTTQEQELHSIARHKNSLRDKLKYVDNTSAEQRRTGPTRFRETENNQAAKAKEDTRHTHATQKEEIRFTATW
jgi:hypothetical protein